MCRNITNKKKVVSDKLIRALIRIAISNCDENAAEVYAKDLRFEAVKCLITLGGMYNRKMYIPGETRDQEYAR